MFEDLSVLEKRRVLLSARIRFGLEGRVPRQRAIDQMVGNALFVGRSDEWFSAKGVSQVFKDIGGIPTLHLYEIKQGLKRLHKAGRCEERYDHSMRENVYRLCGDTVEQLQTCFKEASERISRVLATLFSDVLLGGDADKLAPFFLETVCAIFAVLGSQWVSYLEQTPLPQIIGAKTVDTIITDMMRKHELDPSIKNQVKLRTKRFFQETDPDFSQVKFALAQSFYVAKLLGVEGKDFLSEEIFANGKLYLDSNVVIPALLRESRHFQVFQELRRVCTRLNMELLVTRPTVDEVRRVAAVQEQLAPELYDLVPDKIARHVKGDFFYTYRSMKEADPNYSFARLFEPFRDLTRTLGSAFEIRIVDDEIFEQIPYGREFDGVKNVLQEEWIENKQQHSVEIQRKQAPGLKPREKTDSALTHDGQVFRFLQVRHPDPHDKCWFVTRDSSLPSAWAKLQGRENIPRCFPLDGLLQTISPFVVSEEELRDFPEVFSQVVSSQLFPQRKIFDIEDFTVFQNVALDCAQLTEEEIEEYLTRVKYQVLKGLAYRPENLEEVGYELQKMLARRGSTSEALISQRDELLKRLEQQKGEHESQLKAKDEEYSSRLAKAQSETENSWLMEQTRARQLRRATLVLKIKQLMVIAVIALACWRVTKWADAFGAGQNLPQKILSFGAFYAMSVLTVLVLAKITLFRKQKLREVFSSWHEVKEFFK